jgi:putative transposase
MVKRKINLYLILPQMPEPILLIQIFAKLTALERIHHVSTDVEPS